MPTLSVSVIECAVNGASKSLALLIEGVMVMVARREDGFYRVYDLDLEKVATFVADLPNYVETFDALARAGTLAAATVKL